jgi:hypothetical protein
VPREFLRASVGRCLVVWLLVPVPLSFAVAGDPPASPVPTVLDPLETPKPEAPEAPLGRELEESDAVLRRRGRGEVESLGITGLTWATIDPIRLVIRLRATAEGTRLRRLPADSWPDLTHSLTLEGAVAAARPVPYVDLTVARRAAAGTILVLSDASGHVAFRVTGSAATATERGTLVELVGRVRR